MRRRRASSSVTPNPTIGGGIGAKKVRAFSASLSQQVEKGESSCLIKATCTLRSVTAVRRIWFDVLTPKHVLFCHALAPYFEKAAYDVTYTTREYAEVQGQLDLLGIKAAVVGRHGGADKLEKLVASAERTADLARYVKKLQPDIAFGFASPECARVAFGLGIPYFTANDSPHSRFVAQLSIPFAEVLFTSWFMIPAWRKLDVPLAKIVSYHALDPVAWLRGFMPDKKTLTGLRIDAQTDYVVIRPEEAQASYISDVANVEKPVIAPVIEKILAAFPNLPLVVLSRYEEQRKALRSHFRDRIILPNGVVDAPSLIASASLVVGAGGTMNQEACLLGVPVISCYPGAELEVEKFLVKEKLLYRIPDPAEAAEKAVEILRNRQRYQTAQLQRASRLLTGMENPAEVISSWILKRKEQLHK
jgi:predicted glycosyltransferase